MPSSKKRKLPSHLHAVMGEANLRLARGDPTGAQKLCKEVIRQGVYVCNSAYDKYKNLSRHSLFSTNSTKFPMIIYSKVVRPNVIWPDVCLVWTENVL